jgi:hypothetical protein
MQEQSFGDSLSPRLSRIALLIQLIFCSCDLVFRDPFRFFRPPQHWCPPCFSRKTTHDATIEEVQEERSHRDRPRRTPSWRRQRNLSSYGTFAHHRSRAEGKTRGSPESKGWESSTYSRIVHTTRCSRNEDDDDEVVDRELEEVQQKIQQLQKEKERFANQLQAKRKASEKLEKLNQAKEQIERI